MNEKIKNITGWILCGDDQPHGGIDKASKFVIPAAVSIALYLGYTIKRTQGRPHPESLLQQCHHTMAKGVAFLPSHPGF